tara:strand:- start:734 stop:1072 length:339 start_codon:yes stop_codon:yes gene_type:complete
MKLKEYTNIQDYIEIKKSEKKEKIINETVPLNDVVEANKEKRLLTKKDFIESIINDKYKNEFGQWKIKDLRDHFSLTHMINGRPVNLQGHCFRCLKPLRADYTQFENYCLDC